MEKYYYHGTVDKFVPSILKEGLKPEHKNAWDMNIDGFFYSYNPSRDDDPGFVYLIADLAAAKKYAAAKAKYFRTDQGKELTLDLYSGVDAQKSRTAPVIPDARGVVLRVKLSDLKTERDPQDRYAVRVHGDISPKLLAVSSAKVEV